MADGKVHAGARAGFSVLDCGRSWAKGAGGSGVTEVRERERERGGSFCAVCAVVSFLLSQIELGSPLSFSLF